MAVVIVAGGATGIGRAVVQAFSAQGDSVFLADVREAAARETAAGAGPGPVEVLVIDLAAPGAADAVVSAAVARFGALDTLYATAALMPAAPLAEWTETMWDESLGLNLKMPFLMARAAAPWLAKSVNPSIIFTASTGALRGHAGMPAYHASKTGLLGLARSLADELGPQGVRVNCVLPGWIKTPFNDPYWSYQPDPEAAEAALTSGIPLRRQGSPEEVAGPVLFLASPAARYVTGTSLVIDGGYTAV
ncbi:SDR family NAD(P)-dependent oxidoreductase [Phenylobacterium sp. LjRoot225]|uniref:SDR family NAD(P)-dependent oxidoreductase n=1 Tax=Phenylobacterium sp. LjRoot225 TaxID=3342285 RepID=UPI003ED13931